MPTQYKRSWVLLTSLAACAGLATTPVFAVEPQALMRLVEDGDVHSVSGRESQSRYIIKLLEGSAQFRVRAQAAISLGAMETSFAARAALTAALQDEQPAVRAAAATSLGRIGDTNHVSALRMLAGDPEAPVRNAARAAIGRLERPIEESPDMLDTLAVTTNANRL